MTSDGAAPAVVEFAPDPKDRRRNLILSMLIGVSLVAVGVIALQLKIRYDYAHDHDLQDDRHRDDWIMFTWILLAVAVPVTAVRFWRLASPRGLLLRVAPEAMTLRFGARETRLPWADVAAMAVSNRGWLMIKPGPGLSIPGRWQQRWWVQGTFGRWIVVPAAELFGGAEFPRWSRGVRDWVLVANVKWFPAADRDRLTDLVTRYANA